MAETRRSSEADAALEKCPGYCGHFYALIRAMDTMRRRRRPDQEFFARLLAENISNISATRRASFGRLSHPQELSVGREGGAARSRWRLCFI